MDESEWKRMKLVVSGFNWIKVDKSECELMKVDEVGGMLMKLDDSGQK